MTHNKKLFFEFTSRKFPNYTQDQLVEFEKFFKTYNLNFILAIKNIDKFRLGSRGLNHETGMTYIVKSEKPTTILFYLCYYYGPNIETLSKEIEQLNFKNNKQKLFDYLKKKKYILSIRYNLFLTGGYGRVNVVFGSQKQGGDRKDEERASLTMLNHLLTKIFKIILINDAFKLKNASLIDVSGSTTSRNILYRKFLLKYLQGKPYKLAGAEDKRSSRLTIIPIGHKADYGQNFLQENKNVKEIISQFEKLHDLFSDEIKMKVFKYLKMRKKNKQSEQTDIKKDRSELIKDLEKIESDEKKRKQILDIFDTIMAKKIEIEKDLIDKGYNVSLYKFISDHLDYGYSKYNNKKILKFNKYEKNKKDLSVYAIHMANLGEYCKEKKIDFKAKRGNEIMPEEIIDRIEKIKKHIKDPFDKLKKIIEPINKEIEKLYEERLEKYKEISKKMSVMEKEMDEIIDNDKYHPENDLGKKYRELREEKYELEKPIKEIEYKIDDKNKIKKENNVKYNYYMEIEKSINVIVNLFKENTFESIINKYGYKSFREFILDIGQNNLLHRDEIKNLFLEYKLVNSSFVFYLLFS
jgi:hypothetical protein